MQPRADGRATGTLVRGRKWGQAPFPLTDDAGSQRTTSDARFHPSRSTSPAPPPAEHVARESSDGRTSSLGTSRPKEEPPVESRSREKGACPLSVGKRCLSPFPCPLARRPRIHALRACVVAALLPRANRVKPHRPLGAVRTSSQPASRLARQAASGALPEPPWESRSRKKGACPLFHQKKV